MVLANTWLVSCFGFLVYFFLSILYSWDRAEPALVDRIEFDHLYVIWRVSAQGSAFWGRGETAPHLRVKAPPSFTRRPFPRKKTIWRAWIGVFEPISREIVELAYYRNYCVDCNQILHDDKDHLLLFVGGHRRSQKWWWRVTTVKVTPMTTRQWQVCERVGTAFPQPVFFQ